MAIWVSERHGVELDSLCFEPTAKRVRALLAGRPAFDTTRARLVWEPQRVVPQYAVPLADVLAEIEEAGPGAGDRAGPGPIPAGPDGRAVLIPETGFGVHSCEGTPMTIRLGGQERVGAAFRPVDPDLDDHVVLDFSAFDTWLEEDDEIIGHPQDPFKRIDVRRSSRAVRIELDGHVLAESTRPSMLFETSLPQRFYLPPDDVDRTLLRPSDTTSVCAYKGVASYWSIALPDRVVPDLVWTYRDPLRDAVPVRDLLCFFTERLDVVLDGVRQERPTSPWSEAPV